ncbi:hypothetical protein ABAC460_23500 [Asticcacaulis sp. AC460]|uniref:hypothetical protein n=1 Tax=Asticcacaulis sp. AC460 TaxID=1282360 RepID=UPI0003C3D0D7|nr:hypothetical protein [Asticcacaulis sp. AC460]ESQ85565.1 hypothetical protein ABAC460_23500 [Asticcacaulis sp. AC460]
MKRLVSIAALVCLTACSAEGPITAWRLNAFIEKPTEASFREALKSAEACLKPGCRESENLTAAMIDGLTGRMREGNLLAVRLAMASNNLIGDSAGADGALAHSFGRAIKTQPEAFLDTALTEDCHRLEFVTTTPEAMLDNDGAQYDELVARRTALMSVTRPYLQDLRDEYVTALDKAIAKADRARFKPVPAVG